MKAFSQLPNALLAGSEEIAQDREGSLSKMRSAPRIFAHHGRDPISPARPSPIAAELCLVDYDLAPKFPKLVDFLDYWATNLDGPLYGVRVANCPICLTMAHGHALRRSHAEGRCGSR